MRRERRIRRKNARGGFSRSPLLAVYASLLLLLGACGGRSAVLPEDVGTDDATPRSYDASLNCHRESWIALPMEALTLAARPMGIAPSAGRFVWELLEPTRSESNLLPQGGPVALVFPSPGESLRVQLGWFDDEGALLDACEYRIEVRTDGPIARCPFEPKRASIDEEVLLVGKALDASAAVEGRWSLHPSSPQSAELIDAGDGRIQIRFAELGLHSLIFEAINERGEHDQCTHSILVYEPLEIECSAEAQLVRTGAAVKLRARSLAQPLWGGEWRLIDGDANGVLIDALERIGEAEARFISPGHYRFAAVFEDALGEDATCEITIEALDDSVELSCPRQIQGEALQEIEIIGRVRALTPWEATWRLVSTPKGSAAADPEAIREARARFTPDLVGKYRVELIISDAEGTSASCLIDVDARGQEGLRVELIWLEGSDLDLHLLHPNAQYYFDEEYDCYHGVCIPSAGKSLDWGEPGSHDDPRLDIDNQHYGPENINIDHPAPGTYRLSVYVWSWRAGRDVQDLRDRVRIYCGGSLVYETASSPLTFDRALWRIADITIEEDGRCRVEPLPVIAEPMSRSEQMPR